MDRNIEKVVSDTTPTTFEEGASLAEQNAASDLAFLDYEDEDELERFHSKQTKHKIQQKRRRAAGA